MSQRTQMGINRTGIATSRKHAHELMEGLALQDEVPSPEPDATGIRAAYLLEGGPVGSMPPPPTLKGMAGAMVEGFAGKRMHVLLDKLGERAAYERSGTRLYDAMLRRVMLLDAPPGDLTADGLREIRDEEAAHFRLVTEAIEDLGGDPTVMTPCADATGVQAMGLMQAINEPRATVAQGLQTLLAAELVDEASWELLIELARDMRQEAWAERFSAALEAESRHVARVRTWLAQALQAEVALLG